MSVCRWAGAPCPNAATALVRITDVGLRAICGEHVAVLERLGMDHKIETGSGVGPVRTVPPTVQAPLPVDPPAWRPVWLTRLVPTDRTGSPR